MLGTAPPGANEIGQLEALIRLIDDPRKFADAIATITAAKEAAEKAKAEAVHANSVARAAAEQASQKIGEAQALMARARQMDEEVATTIKLVDERAAKLSAQAEDQDMAARVAAAALEHREQNLVQAQVAHEERVVQLRDDTAAREAALALKEADADRLIAEAQAMRSEYESKLANLRALTS